MWRGSVLFGCLFVGAGLSYVCLDVAVSVIDDLVFCYVCGRMFMKIVCLWSLACCRGVCVAAFGAADCDVGVGITQVVLIRCNCNEVVALVAVVIAEVVVVVVVVVGAFAVIASCCVVCF